MQHRMTAGAQNRLAGDVQTVLVTYDYTTARPIPVPAEWRARIGEHEGRTFELDTAHPATAAAG